MQGGTAITSSPAPTDASATDGAPIGVVEAVRGSVVDVRFPEGLPAVNDLLRVASVVDDPAAAQEEIALEVVSHLDDRRVRTIALLSTQGLARGTPVRSTGAPITAPVGDALLGRMFNVFGEPVDGAGPVEGTRRRSVHRPPPPLARRSATSEIFA